MERKKETIQKPGIFYSLLKAYEGFAFNRFYRHVQVIGKENIPLGEKYILTPNHQNALMDALAVLNTCGTDTVFLARSDIFRKKRQADLLRSFKILPVYRMRDGMSELSKNEEVFTSTIDVLDDKVPICIMPEGNHGEKRRLRPLVKGVFRIAFRAQQEFADKHEIKIIPVGIDYEHYQKFFQDILIVYGQPIEVSEYFSLWEENQALAINKLKERLASDLKKLMIHIGDDEYYDVYQDLREIYNKRMRIKAGILGKSHYERFRADKQMIRILDDYQKAKPEVIQGLSEKVRDYMNSLKNLNLRNWIFERSGFTTRKLIYKRFGILLSLPFFLYGFINNILPFYLPVRLTRGVKDPQFISSFRFVLAMIFFPLFYALQSLLVAILTGPAWIALLYLLSLPASAYFALFWSIWFKRWRAGLKYRRMKRTRDEKILSLERKYKEIMETMDKLVDDYMKGVEFKDQKLKYE